MTDPNLGAIRYSTLCPVGTNTQNSIDHHIGRRRRVAFLLMDAETEQPTNIPRYQTELADLKSKINRDRGILLSHVAHCTDGCARDTTGGLSGSAFKWDRAPSNNKPELPGMSVIAARLRDGEALEAIAAEYDRSPETLRPRLNDAGFSSRDGRPNTAPPAARHQPGISLLPDEPWRDDALCAQTDPESFYPEKGGSSREAKSVCARCTVSAECLDYALEHDERHGIWGGLSERDRRRISQTLRTPNLDNQEAS